MRLVLDSIPPFLQKVSIQKVQERILFKSPVIKKTMFFCANSHSSGSLLVASIVHSFDSRRVDHFISLTSEQLQQQHPEGMDYKRHHSIKRQVDHQSIHVPFINSFILRLQTMISDEEAGSAVVGEGGSTSCCVFTCCRMACSSSKAHSSHSRSVRKEFVIQFALAQILGCGCKLGIDRSLIGFRSSASGKRLWQ